MKVCFSRVQVPDGERLAPAAELKKRWRSVLATSGWDEVEEDYNKTLREERTLEDTWVAIAVARPADGGKLAPSPGRMT